MNPITEVVDYLTRAKVFYFTSVDGDKPKARPFGFAMEYEGKVYFTTNNTRPVVAELQRNPHFEATVMHPDKPYHWLRFSGEAVFDATLQVKEKAFELVPNMWDFYKTPANPDFAMFSAKNGEALYYEGAERRTVWLP